MDDYVSLAQRLDQIVEEIDEAAFDGLREAVADGEVERPPHDKTLMQARRAVTKAAFLLRSIRD